MLFVLTKWVTISAVRTQICRLALSLILGLVAAGFFQPASALACGNSAPPDCCQAPATPESHDPVTADQPCPFMPASSSQFCASCPRTFSLIGFEHIPFVFNDASVSAIVVQDPAFLTRTTRPPYPPPRS